MTKRKITYTVKVGFGREVLTTTKNDFAEVQKLVDVVLDLGGNILEIELEELPWEEVEHESRD